MPTYEFNCKQCSRNFEVFTSIPRKGETVCPQCGSGELREVLGAFFTGGALAKLSAGQGSACDGNCTGCGSSCHH